MARRRRGRVVRQRPAKPRTAVRVRSAPLYVDRERAGLETEFDPRSRVAVITAISG